MKTISGKVVSTKPISLSDAAQSLAKFAASDQGASHSVSSFIQRAAHSFNNLVHFHHTLTPNSFKNDNFTHNDPKFDEISQISHISGVKVETLVKNEGFSNGVQENKKSKDLEVKEDGVVSSDKMKKKKKKKNKGVGDGEVEDQKSINNNGERVGFGAGLKEQSEKNEPQFVKMETEGEEVKKKKKKKNRGVGENEGVVEKVKEDLVVKEDGERKKSKSVDGDASQNGGSAEQSKKKKSKKTRIEGEK